MNCRIWVRVIGAGLALVLLVGSAIQSPQGNVDMPPAVATGLNAGTVYYFPAEVVADGIAYGQEKEITAPYLFLRNWLSQGTGDSQFKNPTGMAVDASGNVYVVDKANHRIQKFDSSDNFTLTLVSQGTGDSQINNLMSVAVDASGNVYVTDSNSRRLLKSGGYAGSNLDNSGTFTFQWGTEGTNLPSLLPDTTYHYRALARGDGTVYSADIAFETGPEQLDLTEGIGDGQFSANLPGLLPGTTYHYRALARGDGTIYGAEITLETGPEQLDLGDAPDPTFPTLLAHNGASHILDGKLFLGRKVDSEPDGQPSADATADDMNGNDDENGVAFTSPLTPGQQASIYVNANIIADVTGPLQAWIDFNNKQTSVGVTADITANVTGLLQAWIDFNRDGDWDDEGEQIFADKTLDKGLNQLDFAVPPQAVLGSTFARFRFSTQQGLSYNGNAPNGEVEDYEVMIEEGVSMVRVLIGVRSPVRAYDTSLIRGRGGIIEKYYHLIPAISAMVPERALSRLRALRRFSYIELDGEVQALDQTVPWGISSIGAESVHSYNKGDGVKVAVIDTGIDLEHQDINVAGDVTFVSGTSSGDDDNGHGTHVAGIIGALDNDIGVVGVAPDVDLYAIKVLNYRGSGWWSDVIRGIEWAVDNNMDVVNMSLGSSSYSSSLKASCDRARDAGVLVVAAAGNSGSPPWWQTSSVVYPAKNDSVIAVGAIDSSGNRASFSSIGPEVEVSAPGKSIYSTYRGDRYTTMSGTSMASPHVAGTAALVIASGLIDDNENGRINDEVRLRLQQTADDLGSLGRDNSYGYGVVDAGQAAQKPLNQAPIARAGPDQTVLVDTTVFLDGSGSTDPDDDSLTYLWSQTGGTTVNLSGNTTASPTFIPTQAGIYTFELVVNDSNLDSSPDDVVITVKLANNPPSAPVADVIPDSPLTADNLICSIDVASVDPDNDPINYHYIWYKNDVVQPTLTSNAVHASYTKKGETWKCEVTPNDGTDNGISDSDQVTIGNSAPIANAGEDQLTVAGNQVFLDGSGSSDPDGDQLIYLWSQTGGTNVDLSGEASVNPNFVPTQAGIYTFELKIDDGSAQDVDSVSVTVTEVPTLVMHIDSIDTTLVRRYSGWRTYATATITIVDPYGNPVVGATVRSHWEGTTSDINTRVTNINGQVTVISYSLRRPPSGTTFTIVVDNVVNSGWSYDTGANNESSDSVSVP
ncbi:S8 family serine peptidase [Chloroflexota bacterium]